MLSKVYLYKPQHCMIENESSLNSESRLVIGWGIWVRFESPPLDLVGGFFEPHSIWFSNTLTHAQINKILYCLSNLLLTNKSLWFSCLYYCTYPWHPEDGFDNLKSVQLLPCYPPYFGDNYLLYVTSSKASWNYHHKAFLEENIFSSQQLSDWKVLK